ncbi:MAG: THUMP domain-containing class I SAM-dependent RNA methyltransferase [Flavobacteriales bacterium]
MQDDFKMLAQTFFGLEGVLAEELKSIGARDVKELNRAVSFKGDLGFMYKANFRLQTALNILYPIETFTFYNEDKFYKKVKQIEWEKHFGVKKTIRVQAVTHRSSLSHSHYAALLCKDAIVDRYREICDNERPNIDSKDPDVPIYLYIDGDKASLYLNSSGAPLYKRGYKTERHEAPINEVLAAGILKLAGWPKPMDFWDPMCGSATFVVEAILMAKNMPAGVVRENYGFMHWNSFDKDLWEKIKEVSLDKIEYFHNNFYASDLSASYVNVAKKHLKNIFLDDLVELKQADFLQPQNIESPRFIVSNPPYDRRIKKDLPKMVEDIGALLKHQYEGSEAWFISPIGTVKKYIGLKAAKRRKLFQGKIECELTGYKMYAGSKKYKTEN